MKSYKRLRKPQTLPPFSHPSPFQLLPPFPLLKPHCSEARCFQMEASCSIFWKPISECCFFFVTGFYVLYVFVYNLIARVMQNQLVSIG